MSKPDLVVGSCVLSPQVMSATLQGRPAIVSTRVPTKEETRAAYLHVSGWMVAFAHAFKITPKPDDLSKALDCLFSGMTPEDAANHVQQQICEESGTVAGMTFIRFSSTSDLEETQHPRVTVDDCIAVVCAMTGFTREELRRKYGGPDHSKAKHTAVFLARRFTGRSTPFIAEWIGYCDHTTALYGMRRVRSVIREIGRSPHDSPEAWASHLLRTKWPAGLNPRKNRNSDALRGPGGVAA